MKIYFIPGLGFDDRIYRNINIENHEVNYINWIDSFKNESIQSYAERLSESIENDGSELILIGHSFGGILCQEIATIKPVQKIILISSIKHQEENPLQFRIMKPTRLYKLFTKELTVKSIKYWGTTHDYETEEEKELVKSMVSKHSNNHLQWALMQLAIWKKPSQLSIDNIIQIHGELDKTFPIKLIKTPTYKIKNSGHFMVYKNAEIEEILNNEINLMA